MRIFYLEDNPLIAFHVEHLIEDLGHTFAGTLDSFRSLQDQFTLLSMDVALVDIDLADGRTGVDAARWLGERSIPCIFLTGQDQIADEAGDLVLGVIPKPVTTEALSERLALVAQIIHTRSQT
jgi:DNA-binding response OmpR family regulator